MTCIVALEHKGTAYLGSDSFMGNADSRDQTSRPKFFTKGDQFVVGFAGSFRGAQVVEHDIKFRQCRSTEDAEAYLVVEVAKKLQHVFSQVGANVKNEETQDSTDASFLICLHGKVFTLQQDYSVIRSSHGFASIGIGRDFALGALSAMVRMRLSPEEKIRRALEIATDLSPQVCGPFHIIEV